MHTELSIVLLNTTSSCGILCAVLFLCCRDEEAELPAEDVGGGGMIKTGYDGDSSEEEEDSESDNSEASEQDTDDSFGYD